MDEQKKEVSAQAQPETAEPMQTDEINEQTVQIEQAEGEMAAESAAEAEQSAQPEKDRAFAGAGGIAGRGRSNGKRAGGIARGARACDGGGRALPQQHEDVFL